MISAQPADEEASLNWLEDLEASHGLKNVDQEIPPDTGTDEFTDWLKGISTKSEKPEEPMVASEEPAPAPVEEALPAQEPAEQATPVDQFPEIESEAKLAEIGELPAWLDGKKEEAIALRTCSRIGDRAANTKSGNGFPRLDEGNPTPNLRIKNGE